MVLTVPLVVSSARDPSPGVVCIPVSSVARVADMVVERGVDSDCKRRVTTT